MLGVQYPHELIRYWPPIYVLCVSSHFWPFTKANLIWVNFNKKTWDSVQIPNLYHFLRLKFPLLRSSTLAFQSYINKVLLRYESEVGPWQTIWKCLGAASRPKQFSWKYLERVNKSCSKITCSSIFRALPVGRLWWIWSAFILFQPICPITRFATQCQNVINHLQNTTIHISTRRSCMNQPASLMKSAAFGCKTKIQVFCLLPTVRHGWKCGSYPRLPRGLTPHSQTDDKRRPGSPCYTTASATPPCTAYHAQAAYGGSEWSSREHSSD